MTSEDISEVALLSSSDLKASTETHTPKGIEDMPDELLLEILSQVSLEQRFDIRRVSQKWNRIVSHIGYHMDPLFLDDRNDTPFYSSDIPIRLNHIVNSIWSIDARYQRLFGGTRAVKNSLGDVQSS